MSVETREGKPNNPRISMGSPEDRQRKRDNARKQ